MNKYQFNAILRHPGYNGGGSSGGSENSATKAQGRMLDYNLGQLQKTDAMREPYMAGGLQGAMNAYDKYDSAGYQNKMLGQANTDAMSSFGTAMGAVNRNMSRYGAAFNPNRMSNEMASAGLQGAAMRTGAMNNMRTTLDNQQTTAAVNKWKLLNDMQTESMTQGNQIASGYGQMGGTMAQNAATQAQGLAGLGQTAMGATDLYLKGASQGAWADGGYIDRFAGGGSVGRRAMLADPNAAGQVTGSPQVPQQNPVAGAVSGAGTAMRGANMVKGLGAKAAGAVSNPATAGSILNATGNGVVGVGNAQLGHMAGEISAFGNAGVNAAATTGLEGATAAGVAAEGALATGAAETAAGAALAAEGTAAAGTLAAANAWNPVGWVIGAGALLGAMDLFADGGDIQGYAKGGKVKAPKLNRATSVVDYLKSNGMDNDYDTRSGMFEAMFNGEVYKGTAAQNAKMLARFHEQDEAPAQVAPNDGRAGGNIVGPGTGTSDSIPATVDGSSAPIRVANGEFIVNKETMDDPNLRQVVEQANQVGLSRRYGGQMTPATDFYDDPASFSQEYKPNITPSAKPAKQGKAPKFDMFSEANRLVERINTLPYTPESGLAIRDITQPFRDYTRKNIAKFDEKQHQVIENLKGHIVNWMANAPKGFFDSYQTPEDPSQTPVTQYADGGELDSLGGGESCSSGLCSMSPFKYHPINQLMSFFGMSKKNEGYPPPARVAMEAYDYAKRKLASSDKKPESKKPTGLGKRDESYDFKEPLRNPTVASLFNVHPANIAMDAAGIGTDFRDRPPPARIANTLHDRYAPRYEDTVNRLAASNNPYLRG